MFKLNFETFIKIAKKRNIITELFVEKKLPELLKGKNSKKITKKKGMENTLDLKFKFLK